MGGTFEKMKQCGWGASQAWGRGRGGGDEGRLTGTGLSLSAEPQDVDVSTFHKPGCGHVVSSRVVSVSCLCVC